MCSPIILSVFPIHFEMSTVQVLSSQTTLRLLSLRRYSVYKRMCVPIRITKLLKDLFRVSVIV